jgi:hypothetical protein
LREGFHVAGKLRLREATRVGAFDGDAVDFGQNDEWHERAGGGAMHKVAAARAGIGDGATMCTTSPDRPQ